MENRFDQLLQDYRSIWNNRLLHAEELESEQILQEAIKREINDENSHPRIRRTKYEKYFMATQRILDANIPNDSKLTLIDMHKTILEKI